MMRRCLLPNCLDIHDNIQLKSPLYKEYLSQSHQSRQSVALQSMAALSGLWLSRELETSEEVP